MSSYMTLVSVRAVRVGKQGSSLRQAEDVVHNPNYRRQCGLEFHIDWSNLLSLQVALDKNVI